jgi:GDPmannose 4,6-dehydratase
MAFGHIGIEMTFIGEGIHEIGSVGSIDESRFEQKVGAKCTLKIGQQIVFVDPKYFRPTEVDLLIGDPTKAMTKLGWKPKYNLESLVVDMMDSDIRLMQKENYLREGGFQSKNYFE